MSDNPAPQNIIYREKFDVILNGGAQDAWLGKKYPKDTPTFAAGTRIDYAVLSPSAFENLDSVNIDSVFRERGLSDHSGLIVDFIN